MKVSGKFIVERVGLDKDEKKQFITFHDFMGGEIRTSSVQHLKVEEGAIVELDMVGALKSGKFGAYFEVKQITAKNTPA